MTIAARANSQRWHRPLTHDWRIWTALILSAGLIVASLVANDVHRNRLLLAAEGTGFELLPPRHSEDEFRPSEEFGPEGCLLELGSRWPEWMCLRLPGELTRTCFVTVKRAVVIDEGIRWRPVLKTFPELDDVQLQLSPDSEPGGLNACLLPNLKHLTVTSSTLLTASFRDFGSLPKLRSLEIQAEDVSEECLQSLLEVTQLESLTIESPGILRRWSPALQKLRERRFVRVSASAIPNSRAGSDSRTAWRRRWSPAA